MTDTDIRTALERATGDLSTPPDLLDRVRAGGRRRVVRRRTHPRRDRRRFVVQTLTAADRQIRLFLLLGTPEPVLKGFVDPGAPLPVRVRLPDRQGVVVAAEGAALRYRAQNGPWLPVGGDAALLPDAADEVEVTGAGGRTVRVGLPD